MLRSSAEPLGGLSGFLEKYVGACGQGSAPKCESNASSFRSQANGKRFFFAAGDESSSLLSVGRCDAATGGGDLKLTPFFSAGGDAPAPGAPPPTDPAGDPPAPPPALRGPGPGGGGAPHTPRLVHARE